MADDLRARVEAAVRNDKSLQELVAMLPISAGIAETVWQVLAVAYSAGMVAGSDAILEKIK